MIGFFIGTACLIGFIATMRRGRFGHGHHGFGGGCGGGYRRGFGGYDRGGHGGPFDGYDGHGRDDRDWRGGGGRGGFRGGPWARGFDFLTRAFRELDTTPGQEKVMREAATGLWTRGREAKAAVKDARKGFAQAVREESFDEVSLGEATAKLEEATDGMRKAIIDALAKVHGVLDDRQRKLLADFIESGSGGSPFGRGYGGPYRGGRDDHEGSTRAPWEV